MENTIAVVDDDRAIIELIRVQLKLDNFEIEAFEDGESFLEFVDLSLPCLVILDLSLPTLGGLDVLRKLKREGRTLALPVIILSGRGTEMDRILGLELGADDYVVKPFSPRELSARVRAVLRRAQSKDQVEAIVIDGLEIDRNRFEVHVEGRKIDLTTSEFKIICALAEHPGWVFTRSQLLEILTQDQKIVLERTVDVHIRHLREKLGEHQRLIKTVRGVGYKLDRRDRPR